MIEDAVEYHVVVSQVSKLAVVQILILLPPLQEHLFQILSRSDFSEKHDA
jgi:hypothetical protein